MKEVERTILLTTLRQILTESIGDDLVLQLENTPQASKWHAEGNVLNHTLLVMEQVSKHDFEDFSDHNLMMACAMFHDLGKIDATRIRGDGGITSPGHESYVHDYLAKVKLPLGVDAKQVESICEQHMRAHLYNDGRMSRPAKRKAFEDLPLFDKIMLFAQFDAAGRIGS